MLLWSKTLTSLHTSIALFAVRLVAGDRRLTSQNREHYILDRRWARCCDTRALRKRENEASFPRDRPWSFHVTSNSLFFLVSIRS